MILVIGLIAAAGAEVAAPPVLADVGVDERMGATVPLDLTFRDGAGHLVKLRDVLQGERPVLLTLAYSSCPMLCSLVLRGVAQVAPKLRGEPGKDYTLVTLSIDPDETLHLARRKQEALVSEVGKPGELGAWTYLIGPAPAIQQVAQAVGFRYAKDPQSGEYAHAAAVFVLTPSGRVANYLYGLQHDPSEVQEALDRARREEVGVARSGLVEAVLSCFRFDPAARKYGAFITWGLRLGALAMLGVVGIGIYGLARRDARRRAESAP